MGSFNKLESRENGRASNNTLGSREVPRTLLGQVSATGGGGWPEGTTLAAPRARIKRGSSGVSEVHARVLEGFPRRGEATQEPCRRREAEATTDGGARPRYINRELGLPFLALLLVGSA